MALFEEMKTQVQTSVKAGLRTALREGRGVSSELKRKYNETMSVLGDMRADLQSSVSRELGRLNSSLAAVQQSWAQLSLATHLQHTNSTQLWSGLKSLKTELSSYSAMVDSYLQSVH